MINPTFYVQTMGVHVKNYVAGQEGWLLVTPGWHAIKYKDAMLSSTRMPSPKVPVTLTNLWQKHLAMHTVSSGLL